MDSAQSAVLVFLLQATALAQVLAFVFVLAWNGNARKRVGAPIAVVRRRRVWRYVFLAGIALLGLACLAADMPLPEAKLPAAAVLGLAAALLAVQPGFADSLCGESGVQIGWHARRFEELEEWRLTGDHLRWRLGALWIACDLPVAEHARMRERLERSAPGRESRFTR